MKAIVFVQVVPGHTAEVSEALLRVPEVVRLTSITGEFDLVAEIEVERSERLHDLFVDVIDPLDGVARTLTHVVLKEFPRR
ncbi:MAG: hypothetical protein Kow0069_23020 [Promethearchaeota archaeon]